MVYAPDPVRVASDVFANHNKNSDGTSQSISSSGGGKDSDRPGTWGQAAQPVYNRPVAENKPTEPQPEKLTDKPAPNNTPTLTPPKTLAPDPVKSPVNSATPVTARDPNSRRPSNLRLDVPNSRPVRTETARTAKPSTPRDAPTKTTQQSPATARSDDKLRENVCKPRPKDNRPKGGGGGRGFIPWCR